ncbi:MAG: Gldg family protein [Bacteroidota bacterium]
MKKRKFSWPLLGLIAALLLLNVVGNSFFARFDLTAEKRNSLTDLTKETLKELDYPMHAEVFLEGDFLPEIRAFQEAIKTQLAEMSQYADLSYDFINPEGDVELITEFQRRGFREITELNQKSELETTRQRLWPILKLNYGGLEPVFINLVQGSMRPTRFGMQADYLRAESNLENLLTSKLLTMTEGRLTVGLLQGHGELDDQEIRELGSELANRYNLFKYNMRGQLAGRPIDPRIDVLLVLQPTQAFTERDKYELDQYIMRGGSVLFVVDEEVIDMDMYLKQSTLTDLRDLNLSDMFMKYGFSLNSDLIQDLQCATLDVRNNATEVQFEPFPWVFYPLLSQFPEHPITRNIDAALLRYASSLRPLNTQGLTYTPFLLSSQDSRVAGGKQFINIGEYVENPPDPATFNQGPQIAGLLVEGTFESVFNFRDPPRDSLAPFAPPMPFLENSQLQLPGESYPDFAERVFAAFRDSVFAYGVLQAGTAPNRRIAIISDGEFVQGEMLQGQRLFMPYDNKNLVLNIIDYLGGDEAISQIRAKEVVLRRLDADKVEANRTGIQFINVALPILFILAFGLIRFYLRRRKNESYNIRA